MKKFLLLFIPFMFFFSCENEEENSLTWGYACIYDKDGDSQCISVVDGPHSSLEGCQSVCEPTEDKE